MVTSFYTKNTGYEQVMNERLLPSLEKFKLKHKIFALNNLGSWNLNIYQKALVLKKMLEEYSENIVWLDADAVVQRYPDKFDTLKADFACHFRFDGIKLSSGTMFFRNTEKIKSLINQWIDEIKHHSNYGDETEQLILQNLLKKRGDILVENLPLSYSMIFDARPDQRVEEPVIEHFQASRKLKKTIGDNRKGELCL